jgi:hypothetical protein
MTSFKNIKDIKDINPAEKIKNEWKSLIEEAKKEQEPKKTQSDEEKPK